MRIPRLWERIRRRLGVGDDPHVTDSVSSGGHKHLTSMPKARRTGFLHVDAFAGELVRIKDGGQDDPPHLHVLSLADFRNAVGSKWDRLGSLVEVAVDSIIRRHVDSEKDIFTRLDAEIACLTLPHASRAETRTLVTSIVRDISGHLFGEAMIDGRRPQVLAANLPLHDALTVDGDLDHDAIHHALRRASETLVPPSAKSGVKLGGGSGAPRSTTVAEVSSSGPVFAISGGRPDKDDPFSVVIPAPADEITGLTSDSALTLMWTPTWVTGRSAIGAFHARVIRVDKPKSPPLEGGGAYKGLAPLECLTLDRFVATQSARELKSLFFGRQKVGLTVPIHCMSLSPKWREVIRIPFEDCPPEARRKFLKIEVFGLTPTIPGHILRRMFEPLEKIGCDVMARIPLSAVDMIPALTHVKAVGVDLGELPEGERVGDDELFARLEAFRIAAKQSRIACYVWGVRRRPLIAKVVAAGYSLINGPGVMCDLGEPMLPSGKARP